jgi:hypothetical protein
MHKLKTNVFTLEKTMGGTPAMNQTTETETFEEVLLSYTQMCYSMALAMTRDPENARDLTHDVMTWAWHFRNNPDAQPVIKKELLGKLRERFLCEYLESRPSAGHWPGAREGCEASL